MAFLSGEDDDTVHNGSQSSTSRDNHCYESCKRMLVLRLLLVSQSSTSRDNHCYISQRQSTQVKRFSLVAILYIEG